VEFTWDLLQIIFILEPGVVARVELSSAAQLLVATHYPANPVLANVKSAASTRSAYFAVITNF